MIRRLILAATVAALAVPLVGHTALVDPNCGREKTNARFVQPENGKLVIEGPAGAIDVPTGVPVAPGVVLSTNGTITVKIQQVCVESYFLRVTKNGTQIHGETVSTDCSEQTVSRTVTIGLDGGEYRFELLEGWGCNFVKMRESSEGHYVGDPPLPL